MPFLRNSVECSCTSHRLYFLDHFIVVFHPWSLTDMWTAVYFTFFPYRRCIDHSTTKKNVLLCSLAWVWVNYESFRCPFKGTVLLLLPSLSLLMKFLWWVFMVFRRMLFGIGIICSLKSPLNFRRNGIKKSERSSRHLLWPEEGHVSVGLHLHFMCSDIVHIECVSWLCHCHCRWRHTALRCVCVSH